MPTRPPKPPTRGAGARTHALLLTTAMEVIHDGHVPSIAELAVRARVSRATAYRYFPSRSALITAVVDRSLAPVRAWESKKTDGAARVIEMFTTTFPSFKEFEPQLRAAVQLSLEQWALERAGLLEEEPYRRGHRVGIISHAVEPLQGQLKPRTLDRLKKALSIVYGIEPHIVLKDIWGASDREVEAVALWMADALVRAAVSEAADASRKPRAAAHPEKAGNGAAPARKRTKRAAQPRLESRQPEELR